ncbi:hypothetical protein AB205_0056830 [Aquarana catesbeiana]|uniref:Uncharacterized protein n=1 Tax=Aquarana catesbeiana TaxID=8400 RepID=A0A2G9RBY3_AQUCT|nr:hypothetical protein AB205_0056830 [Aquarana catesbeiana]
MRIFLVGQFSALILAFLFRYYLPPSQYGPRIRHGVASLLGICLSVYCFGWVCYDRSPYNPLLSTFVLSAAWHGVHPGYYCTFLTAVPITLAARRGNRMEMDRLFVFIRSTRRVENRTTICLDFAGRVD